MINATFALVLALQAQPAGQTQQQPVYATPALAEFVARAAAANASPPASLEGYRARVETELSFVRTEPDGRETLLQLEQLASDVFWRRDGGLLQEMIGYRSQTLGATFSGLSFFDVPWLVPTLFGDRLDLVRTGEAQRSETTGAVLNRRATHPFAARRDDVYRFTGGDTVDVITLPDRTIRIARVHVSIRATPARPTLLFEGDIDVDADRMNIVRMQGRLVPTGRGGTALDAIAQGVLFVRFTTAEYEGEYWLPREQRFEAQAVSRLAEGRVVFRAVTRFVDVEPNDPLVARAPDPREHPYGVIRGGKDMSALSQFTDWRLPIGTLSADANAHDFDAFAPPSIVPGDEPRLSFGVRHFSQLVRINHVEGVFTGGGLVYEAGTRTRGAAARLHGGYAWSEQAVRGGAEAALRRGGWEYIARAERQLSHTNDFTNALEPEPGVPPVFGAEQYDYVDRLIGGAVVRSTAVDGWTGRAELARAADRNVGRNVVPLENPDSVIEPINASRLNRPAFEGDFWLARAELRRNPAAGGLSLQPGLGLSLSWEGAAGELDWQRLEAGASMRRMFGRWTLSGSADAGIVFSDSTPPQAMFELGTITDLPGFAHKAFTGDRAALTRLGVMYTLPFFNAPIRMGSLWLPAPAPAPSAAIQVGWTDAGSSTAAIMDRFGWQTSNGARAAIDLRMRFFGGAVSIGAARPLDDSGSWRFVWGLTGGI